MRGLLLTGLIMLAVSFGAYALTGSGDSASGALDTVSPSLQSVSAVTEKSLAVTFSEAMRSPDVTTPGNYAVSGLGVGTLSAHPDGVTGGGPHTLSWSAGEMQDGASMTVTATGLQDTVGNPINPAQNSVSGTGLGVAPVLTNLTANPSQASVGETVTITFTCSEVLEGDPDVTVNGHAAMWVSGGKAANYTYEYKVRTDDPLGMAGVSVTGFDVAGNLGSLSSDAALEIVEEQAGLPLRAWPVLVALLLVGVAVFARRRKSPFEGALRGMFFLLIAMLLCSSAFAAAPSVTNVTFTQSPNGATATQVEITYDLDAPNGPCGITVSLSKDGGADGYIHPVTTVTGDLAGVTTGTGKHLVWDIRADYPEENIPNARIRVVADDGAVLTEYFRDNDADTWGDDDDTQMLVSPAAPYTATRAGDCNDDDVDINPDAVEICGNMIDDNCDDQIDEDCRRTLTYLADAQGSISGPTPQTVNYGQAGQPVTAVADTGYHFVQWSDGSTQNPRQDTNITAAFTVTASFAINTYAIGVTSSGNGAVGGDGIYSHGTTVTLSATPDTGFHFMNWTEGGTPVSTDPAYGFTATGARTLAGNFAINTYTLTYTAGANGSIAGVSPQTVNYGGGGTEVTAAPNGGYSFSQWSDGVLAAARTDTNVTADITVTATFVAVPAPPEVTAFAINSDAVTTTNPVVTLNNTCVGSPTQYMASESLTFPGASWQAYGAAPPFALSAGAGGTKTVYFKVRNESGESAPVSDTITLTERTILLPGSIPLVLVWVPSGSFQMGRYPGEVASYAREDPQHEVTLAYGFWMGKYEITQQQWLVVCGSWPGTAPSSTNGLGNTYPAYYISWDDAKNFITTLNAYIVSSGQGPLTVRLPSEAEWEYACRAGTQTRYYWGDDLTYTQIGAYAWYSGNNSPTGSKPVGGKTSNVFGLYDMIGNVYEWCEDDYNASYTGAPADGSAWTGSPRASDRVFRGGFWVNSAGGCRTAFRYNGIPSYRHNSLGFRLAAVQ